MNVLQAMETTEEDNLAGFILNSATDKARKELQFWDCTLLTEKRERLLLAITIKESVELICNLLEMVTEEAGDISTKEG